MFGLVAASCATAVGTSTVTAPSNVGVIKAVYSNALTVVNELIVPLPTTMSDAVNPVTSSLKVIVVVKGTFVVPLAVDVMTTSGFVPSYSTEN